MDCVSLIVNPYFFVTCNFPLGASMRGERDQKGVVYKMKHSLILKYHFERLLLMIFVLLHGTEGICHYTGA